MGSGRSRGIGGLFLLGLTALGGCVIGWQPEAKFHETRTQATAIAATDAVAIDTANGSITVRPSEDGQTEIVAHLRAMTEERLAQVEVRADRQADGSVRIWVQWPGERQSSEGAALEVTIPGAARLDVATSNGAIDLHGLDAPAKLRTSNGSVSVRDHRGAIDVVTSNGAVRVAAASADVDARSSNGRIEIAQASGVVGSIRAHTSNGSIRLDLASGFAGAITASTSNGSLNLPSGPDVTLQRDGRHTRALRIGDGQTVVEASTSNGAVTINRH